MFFPNSSNLKSLLQYSQPQNQSFPLCSKQALHARFFSLFPEFVSILTALKCNFKLAVLGDVPFKINAADLAFNSETATLFICHYYILLARQMSQNLST